LVVVFIWILACNVETPTRGLGSSKQAALDFFGEQQPLDQVIVYTQGLTASPPYCQLTIRDGDQSWLLRPGCSNASASGTVLRLDFTNQAAVNCGPVASDIEGPPSLYLNKEPENLDTSSIQQANDQRRFLLRTIAVRYLLDQLGVKMPKMRRAVLKRGHLRGFTFPGYFVEDIDTMPGVVAKTPSELIDVRNNSSIDRKGFWNTLFTLLMLSGDDRDFAKSENVFWVNDAAKGLQPVPVDIVDVFFPPGSYFLTFTDENQVPFRRTRYTELMVEKLNAHRVHQQTLVPGCAEKANCDSEFLEALIAFRQKVIKIIRRLIEEELVESHGQGFESSAQFGIDRAGKVLLKTLVDTFLEALNTFPESFAPITLQQYDRAWDSEGPCVLGAGSVLKGTTQRDAQLWLEQFSEEELQRVRAHMQYKSALPREWHLYQVTLSQAASHSRLCSDTTWVPNDLSVYYKVTSINP